jgi:L-ribulokinase
LPAGLPVAAGIIDAHAGAVGAGVRTGRLVKILGTSSCDCMVAPLSAPLPDIPGLCGIVPESIVPGMYGLEAGQPAVGDLFNWFATHFAPARYGDPTQAHERLTAEASKLRPGESGLLALDWNNGNRNVLGDPLLGGLLVGQTLHTTAAEVYRALIEATAFGALTIINRLEEFGVQIEEVVACGGIAEKNAFVLQIYADVCNRPIQLSRSGQTCALGAAIFGAVVGGAHESVEKAQRSMSGVKDIVFRPRRDHTRTYRELNALYMQLHDAFSGNREQPVGRVMKDLIGIRNRLQENGMT